LSPFLRGEGSVFTDEGFLKLHTLKSSGTSYHPSFGKGGQKKDKYEIYFIY